MALTGARWMVLLLALAWMARAHAVEVVNMPTGNSCGVRRPGDTRPRIGLALGGGGARGIAHVRILRQVRLD